jgi:hypothetical protein
LFHYRIKTLLIVTTATALALSVALIIASAIQTRVVASVDHPNGTRLRVTQQFNYQPELFTTSIYFDNGDGNWRWYYFDHEDSYWGHAETEVSGNSILVHSGNRRIEFDTLTGECNTAHGGRRRFQKKSDKINALPPELDDLPSPEN